ncbi:hypothetical protein L6V77_31745 [Myxococcota bacterium]|nr:hypothetical protein [Myxococcota bacterium]
MRTAALLALTALLAPIVVACAPGEDDPPSPDRASGFLELPLVTTLADGTPVRLRGAALHLVTADDAVPVLADAHAGLFSLELPVDLSRVELTGPWQLEIERDGTWQPLAARLVTSPVVDAPALTEGDVVEIGFAFETAHGPVTLGALR